MRRGTSRVDSTCFPLSKFRSLGAGNQAIYCSIQLVLVHRQCFVVVDVEAEEMLVEEVADDHLQDEGKFW